ncbi:putative pyridoxal-dependent decarboxylase domain-containing protein 2 isoform X2 [Ruditapes philippinarum]|uniref:putative pyridoxal-dependent decarboxylase domain-containing protein 2 isoform X2 n=1 Tax=Ruditapes philippinarum TaxID=129788 RepID=UPI00295BB9CA|nr:putative pyridoxal-dependent decarboxylase domain-containing protein 2 isoform X2 [Ruditapes philippinarum]
MAEKAEEAGINSAEVELPTKEGMEAEAPPPYNPPEQTGADAQFQMFMDPMFAELESRVKEHERILDKINDDMKREQEIERKAKEQAHLPGPLKGSGQELTDVMKKVEEMIVYEIDENEEDEENKEEEKPFSFMEQWIENRRKRAMGEEPVEEDEKPEEPKKPQKDRKRMQIRKLDDHGNAAVTSHSLAAYVSCLQGDHLKRFTSKITADCQLWLAKMFRFDEASVFYHEESRDGLVRICRLALYQKYPKYITEGFEALYSRPPVIYISSAAQPGLSNYLCLQLGLPMSSICSVPCNTLFGSNTKMDTEILEKLIQDDIAAAKTPVALIAYAGTPNAGHVDDLEKIKELCKKNNIWMHVDGDNLATLSLIRPPGNIQNARFGDSFTICMGKWLGIPAMPYSTLFKVADPALVHAASLMTFNPYLKLTCLPLWVVLQSLGIENIEQRITHSCDLADFLFNELSKIKTIKQFSREEKKKDDRAVRSISDLISKAISALLVFEMVTPTVVFRYTEDTRESKNVAVAPYAVGTTMDVEDDDDEEVIKKKTYYNSLNIWLGETLQTENPYVEITMVELEREGVCMKFAPLESAQLIGTQKEHLEGFIACLCNQIAILDATTLNYEKFRLITAEQENLKLVEVGNWAGLGAVQYIPSAYVKEGLDLSDEIAKKEVNNLNIELVHKLKDTDSAFSLGYADNEIACVKFGLITDETDVHELIGMVQETGKQVEEASKYFESMSELVRKGIEEANKDLQVENEHKLMQEGVLRQIPMIGSMMNWFSPPPKDAVRGRTFNLVSGTIASTEETYKYKMQIQTEGGSRSRSRQTSGTGSVTSMSSMSSPRSPAADGHPGTKTAGDIKAGLVNSSHEGDLGESHDSLPSPNGNLRLELDSQEHEAKA